MATKSLEMKPMKEVVVSLQGLSYLFALSALAAGIAWIYYIAKAVEGEEIGGESGHASAVNTAESMFQGTVVAILFYFVFRHHFSQSHS